VLERGALTWIARAVHLAVPSWAAMTPVGYTKKIVVWSGEVWGLREEQLVKYIRFGKSGLKMSRICHGSISYGNPERAYHAWASNEEKSRPLIRRVFELRINFFDTANMYSFGADEAEQKSSCLWDLSVSDHGGPNALTPGWACRRTDS